MGLAAKVLQGAVKMSARSIAGSARAEAAAVARRAPGMMHGAIRGTTTFLGAAGWASQHWGITTAAVAAAMAVGGYSSRSRQSIPAGPVTLGNPPNSIGSTKNNLGATGDLVFALNRLR